MLWYIPIFRDQVKEQKQTNKKDWPELDARKEKFSKENWTIGLDVAERKVKAEVYTGS